MKSYGTLIIGAGHAAIGMALALGDALICEESEFCDGDFSLTLKRFSRNGYQPRQPEGKELLAAYQALGIVQEERLNCSALEIGLSRFVLEKGVDILLKSRVVEVKQGEDGYTATLLTNAGLETVKARRIVDTRAKDGKGELSLLFAIHDGKSLSRVQARFPEGRVEQAFYPDRGALHLPAEGDYNRALCALHDRWAAAGLAEKILLVAPRLAFGENRDPIEAFELGFARGKGAE